MIKDYTLAIQQAQELSRREGYSIEVWMLVLNRQAGSDPERLRRAAAILAGLGDDSATTS